MESILLYLLSGSPTHLVHKGAMEPDVMTVLHHNFILQTRVSFNTLFSAQLCWEKYVFGMTSSVWQISGRSDVFEKAPMFGALHCNRVIQSRESSDDWVMTGWSSSRAT